MEKQTLSIVILSVLFLFIISTVVIIIVYSNDEECKESSDCFGLKKECDTKKNICVHCLSSNDCSTKPDNKINCDLLTNTCVECLFSTDCSSNTDGNTHCNATTKSCVECLTSETCLTNTDGKTHCNTNNECVECLENTDCSESTNNICNISTNTCVECNVNSDCINGDCNTSTNICGDSDTSVSCNLDSDCQNGEKCINNICVLDERCFIASSLTRIENCPTGKECSHGNSIEDVSQDGYCIDIPGGIDVLDDGFRPELGGTEPISLDGICTSSRYYIECLNKISDTGVERYTPEQCIPKANIALICNSFNTEQECNDSELCILSGTGACILNDRIDQNIYCNNLLEQTERNCTDDIYCDYNEEILMEGTCECNLCPTNSDNIRLVGNEHSILTSDDILNNKYIINNEKYINIQNTPDKCRIPDSSDIYCSNDQSVNIEINTLGEITKRECVDCPAGLVGCEYDPLTGVCEHLHGHYESCTSPYGCQLTLGELSYENNTTCKRPMCDYSGGGGNKKQSINSYIDSHGKRKYDCIECISNMLNVDAIKPLVSPDDEEHLNIVYNKSGDECKSITDSTHSLVFLRLEGWCPGKENSSWNYSERETWFSSIYNVINNEKSWLAEHEFLKNVVSGTFVNNGSEISIQNYKIENLVTGEIRPATNGDIYYGKEYIPEKYKFSYIGSDGRWIHPCNCGDNLSNGFLNCECSNAQYLEIVGDVKKCKALKDVKCYLNDLPRYEDGVGRITTGSFWNIKDPYCNIFNGVDTVTSSNVEDRCCLGCNHKVYKNGYAKESNIRTSSDYRPYAENSHLNTFDDYERDSFVPFTFAPNIDDPIFKPTPVDLNDPSYIDWRKYDYSVGFNSKPYSFYPRYNLTWGDWEGGNSQLKTIMHHAPDGTVYHTPLNYMENEGELSDPADGLASRNNHVPDPSCFEDSLINVRACNKDSSENILSSNLFTCKRSNIYPIQNYKYVEDQDGDINNTASGWVFDQNQYCETQNSSYQLPTSQENYSQLFHPAYDRGGYDVFYEVSGSTPDNWKNYVLKFPSKGEQYINKDEMTCVSYTDSTCTHNVMLPNSQAFYDKVSTCALPLARTVHDPVLSDPIINYERLEPTTNPINYFNALEEPLKYICNGALIDDCEEIENEFVCCNSYSNNTTIFEKEKYGHQCKWVGGTCKNYIRNSEIHQKQITLIDDVGLCTSNEISSICLIPDYAHEINNQQLISDAEEQATDFLANIVTIIPADEAHPFDVFVTQINQIIPHFYLDGQVRLINRIENNYNALKPIINQGEMYQKNFTDMDNFFDNIKVKIINFQREEIHLYSPTENKIDYLNSLVYIYVDLKSFLLSFKEIVEIIHNLGININYDMASGEFPDSIDTIDIDFDWNGNLMGHDNLNMFLNIYNEMYRLFTIYIMGLLPVILAEYIKLNLPSCNSFKWEPISRAKGDIIDLLDGTDRGFLNSGNYKRKLVTDCSNLSVVNRDGGEQGNARAHCENSYTLLRIQDEQDEGTSTVEKLVSFTGQESVYVGSVCKWDESSSQCQNYATLDDHKSSQGTKNEDDRLCLHFEGSHENCIASTLREFVIEDLGSIPISIPSYKTNHVTSCSGLTQSVCDISYETCPHYSNLGDHSSCVGGVDGNTLHNRLELNSYWSGKACFYSEDECQSGNPAISPNLDGYVCNTLTMDDRSLQRFGLIHNIDHPSSLSELL